MEIGDDVNVRPELRQAALAQLKVSVERRWALETLWKGEVQVSEAEKA